MDREFQNVALQGNSDRNIMQSIRITRRSQSKISGISWATSDEHLPKYYLQEWLKLTTLPWWGKSSRKAASEGLIVLHVRFCSLSNSLSSTQWQAATAEANANLYWEKALLCGEKCRIYMAPRYFISIQWYFGWNFSTS